MNGTKNRTPTYFLEEPWHALGESNPSFQNENLTS